MEGGSPVLEWITYGIMGVILFALGFLALRTAYFFLSLLFIPVLGALERTQRFRGVVRRWGERGPNTGLPVLGATDEAAVDEASAAHSRVRIPAIVGTAMRVGAALGALPGVWLAIRGARLSLARGDSSLEVAANAAFGLCLIAGAGAIVGSAVGALVGIGLDAAGRGSPDDRERPTP
jgi:hypothetical protein